MTTTETLHCKVKDCKRPYRSKGYCVTHFKLWRSGNLAKKPRYKTCSEENCKKALFKFGYCEAHYQAWVASRKAESAPKAAPTPTPAPVEEVKS